MRVLALTRYGALGASSRQRWYQYLPSLAAAGFDVVTEPLIQDGMLAEKYTTGRYGPASVARAYLTRIRRLVAESKAIDLVWIEKELFPWLPLGFEKIALGDRPYILDYDDAVFHAYDQHRRGVVRAVLGRKLDKLMAHARVVVAGNRYLERRAIEAGAARVATLPTVVDIHRYPPQPVGTSEDGALKIVWIGSPSTVHYLRVIEGPLAELALRTRFVLRCIGAEAPRIPGVKSESLPWTETTEARLLAEGAIGIMPLKSTPWELGKCAYKLVQYMACGLPTVASAVGANNDVVVHGETGFLAQDDATWLTALESLMVDSNLRARMGSSGRIRVESLYSVQACAPRLSELLRTAGGEF